ncbi:MAG: ABC transporter substrate-binding protein [Helicobacteraceae bacterium]
MVRILFTVYLLAAGLFANTDMLGRSVDVTNAKRLIFLGPGALRLGVYLGLTSKLAGIENIEKGQRNNAAYSALLRSSGALNAPVVAEGGPGKMPSFEALIRAKPDLIVVSFMDKDQVDLIQKKTRVPVFAVSYGEGYGGSAKKLEAIKRSLLSLGEITGAADRAKDLVAFMNEQEAGLATLEFKRGSAYIGGVSFKGGWGITSSESDYAPFGLLGVKNIMAQEKNEHIFIDLEALVKADPEFVFLDSGGKKQVEQDLRSHRALFDTMRAFKNKNVHWVLPMNFYNTNIEYAYVSAWQIAANMGAKVDLEQKRKAIMQKFLGSL